MIIRLQRWKASRDPEEGLPDDHPPAALAGQQGSGGRPANKQYYIIRKTRKFS